MPTFHFRLSSPISQIHRHSSLVQLASQTCYVPMWWTLWYIAQKPLQERIYSPPTARNAARRQPSAVSPLETSAWPTSHNFPGAAHIPNDQSMGVQRCSGPLFLLRKKPGGHPSSRAPHRVGFGLCGNHNQAQLLPCPVLLSSLALVPGALVPMSISLSISQETRPMTAYQSLGIRHLEIIKR